MRTAIKNIAIKGIANKQKQSMCFDIGRFWVQK